MRKKQEKAKQVLESFNAIASRLSDHSHEWTKEDRRTYGIVYRWIISFCGEGLVA
jgi:hypothetical protein